MLLTLRIYALYNRSKAHLAYMVGSGAVLAGIACVRRAVQPSAAVFAYSNVLQNSMSCSDKRARLRKWQGATLGCPRRRTCIRFKQSPTIPCLIAYVLVHTVRPLFQLSIRNFRLTAFPWKSSIIIARPSRGVGGTLRLRHDPFQLDALQNSEGEKGS